MAKAKLRIGRIDAANGPFTGLQITLPDGNTITMQFRRKGPGGNPEGWVSSSYELDLEQGIDESDVEPMGVGHRFAIND